MNAALGDDRDSVQQTKRRLAAAKRLATIRAKAEAKEAEYRRRVFIVVNGDEPFANYGPYREILYGWSPACDTTGHYGIDDVIADIERRYHLPAMDDPDSSDDQEPGFGARDLTIWRDGRLLAVIRPGAGGGLLVTRLDT
jgi:hypothetical protein